MTTNKKKSKSELHKFHPLQITVICGGMLLLNWLVTDKIGPFLERFNIIEHHFTEELSHVIITVFAVLIGAFVDRYFLFAALNPIIERHLAKNAEDILGGVSDRVIPMSRKFGLSAIRNGLNFGNIIKSLEKHDRIDVMFTYHPDLDRYLSDLIELITDDKTFIKARFLLADPKSDVVRKRFSYITETKSGFTFNTEDMPARLELFFSTTLVNAITMNRAFEEGELFQVKTYALLPDIPIIIIRGSDSAGDVVIKRVLQGYYLKQPAVELPFVEWVPGAGGSSQTMVRRFADYFESRWNTADDLPFVIRKNRSRDE